ncbi:sensor histidine kinase, partial [Cohnella nanjingensis]|nr:hypothetical protein [Cohnella nanjingensis]
EMPEAEFEALQRKLLATEWIDTETTGLVNVHRRLRLAFGEQAGVAFNRRPGGGNQVILTIPARQYPLLQPNPAAKRES